MDSDVNKIHPKIREDAIQGNQEAQFILGEAYQFGRGVPQSDDEALKWYRLCACQENADETLVKRAQYNIDVLHRPRSLRDKVAYENTYSEMSKPSDTSDGFSIIFELLLLLASFALFAYNAYLWLKSGVWFPVESIFVLNDPEVMEWYKNPTSWLGLHQVAKIVSYLPWGSVLTFVIGVIYIKVSD